MSKKPNARYRSVQLDTASLRHQLGMNQTDFWAKLGVTQSGGARCENAKSITLPVFKLLRLQYLEGVDVDETGKTGVVEAVKYQRAEE
jgi:hypothetical protein